MAAPNFFPSFNISSLFFWPLFLAFVYSVFGIVCMIFLVDLFYGNNFFLKKVNSSVIKSTLNCIAGHLVMHLYFNERFCYYPYCTAELHEYRLNFTNLPTIQISQEHYDCARFNNM